MLGRGPPAARASAGARRRALVLSWRLPARRVSRRRVAHRPAVATPRGANTDPCRGVVRSQRRVGEEVRLKVGERASHARAYAKGWEEIEGYLLAAGVVDAVLALEERSVVAEMRAEANRLANADHANLVRTARAAQRQLEAARRLRASGALESLPERVAGGGAAAPAPSRAVAARARRAGEPAGDEGGHAAAAGKGGGARGVALPRSVSVPRGGGGSRSTPRDPGADRLKSRWRFGRSRCNSSQVAGRQGRPLR